VHIHHIGLWLDSHTPYPFKNHRTRDNATRIAGKELEKRKFLRCKSKHLAGTRNFALDQDVGGPDAPIELYGRDRESGTFEMFTEKVFGKDALANPPHSAVSSNRQIADSSLIVDAVLHTPNAIGYVSSPMIRDAKALAISDGSGPAFRPTELAIVTEDYPICRRLLLYDWDAPGSLMDAFVRYVVYKPGQTLVAETPFVALIPRLFSVIPPQNAPAPYKEVASKYSRIGLSFHFSSE